MASDRMPASAGQDPGWPVEDIYRRLVQGIEDYAVFMLDTQGRVMTWNRGAQRINGYSAEEIIGSHFSRFYTQPDLRAGKPERELAQARAVGSVEDEGLRVRKDHSTFWASVVITAIRDERGGLVGYAKVTRDLTERRTLDFMGSLSEALLSTLDAEAALTKVAELLVPFAADRCMVHLREGQALRTLAVVYWDPTKLELAREIDRLFPPRADAPQSAWQVIRSGKPMLMPVVDAHFVTANARNPEHARRVAELGMGSVMCLPLKVGKEVAGALTLVQAESGRHFSASDLQFAERVVSRCSLALENARAHRELQAVLEQTRRESEFRERFIAILGHDLRTPLSAVILLADAIRRNPGAKITERAERISQSARRMSRMVSQLLELARARQANGLELARRPVALREVCGQVVEELAAAHPKVSLKFTASSAAKGLWDPDRMAQVVSNLVSNAIQHGEEGSPVTVSLRVGKKLARLSVHNCGKPIPRELRKEIFDPFRRGGYESRGLGLGLYIADQIVRAHDGKLEVRSSRAHGTVFSAVIPIVAR